jgi:hypothetical protein
MGSEATIQIGGIVGSSGFELLITAEKHLIQVSDIMTLTVL